MNLESCFPFLTEKGHVISLVGGGGKTTLMYAMASCCARKGWKVLVTTTAHIMMPSGGVWAESDATRDALWAGGNYAVAGSPAPEGKLATPPAQLLSRWMKLADLTLIEADGAKRMPCKAPAAHEPVILPQCDTVLAAAGLSALERPLGAVCFRAEQAAALLGVPQDTILTPELLAALLASSQGGRKLVGSRVFCAVLNQADTPQRLLLGKQTLDILQERYQITGVLTHFEEGERA